MSQWRGLDSVAGKRPGRRARSSDIRASEKMRGTAPVGGGLTDWPRTDVTRASSVCGTLHQREQSSPEARRCRSRAMDIGTQTSGPARAGSGRGLAVGVGAPAGFKPMHPLFVNGSADQGRSGWPGRAADTHKLLTSRSLRSGHQPAPQTTHPDWSPARPTHARGEDHRSLSRPWR